MENDLVETPSERRVLKESGEKCRSKNFGTIFQRTFFAPHFSTGIRLVDGTVRTVEPVKDLPVLLRAYFASSMTIDSLEIRVGLKMVSGRISVR